MNPFDIITEQLVEIKALILLNQRLDEPPISVHLEPRFLYSIQELANFLQCSTTTAQKLKNSGKIPFQQFGRKVIFNSQEVLDVLKLKGK